MQPFTGLILFLSLCLLVALIASKKGRSGLIFFFATALPAVPLIFFLSLGSHGNGAVMGWGAFLCPLIGFIVAIMTENKEQMAIKIGDFGEYKKCPFCAEAIRKEAVKCKHCGSSLSTDS